MAVYLCAAGYIGECCPHVHTGVMRIIAPSEGVARRRFSLLLRTEGKDADEEPVVMPDVPIDDLYPVTVAVVRDGKGEERGYELSAVTDPSAWVKVHRVNEDHFELASGVTWEEFEEALDA